MLKRLSLVFVCLFLTSCATIPCKITAVSAYIVEDGYKQNKIMAAAVMWYVCLSEQKKRNDLKGFVIPN